MNGMKYTLNDKKILIVGLGKTGLSIIRFIIANDWNTAIRVTDKKSKEALPPEYKPLEKYVTKGTFGGHSKEDFEWAEVIFLSPGVDLTEFSFLPAFTKDIINDVELAFRCMSDKHFVGITGSNGKSTTTKLIYEFIKEQDPKTVVCGNYGLPILDEIIAMPDINNFVCELSSFQLENVVELAPSISLFLNLSEDHLDRYGKYQNYINAKANIFNNSNPKTKIIYNQDDSLVLEVINKTEGDKYAFSWHETASAFSKEQNITINDKRIGQHSFNLKNCSLKGSHNIENLMAGILAAILSKVSDVNIQKVIDKFEGIAHRAEFVRELSGIKFINDSKGTNVGATKKALEGFSEPIVLIAGGKDKDGSLEDMFEPIKKGVKHIVLIGEAAPRFFLAFKNLTECTKCNSFEEAINTAYKEANAGDVVLLSPACASYDMFKNYEERGNIFKKLVMELKTK